MISRLIQRQIPLGSEVIFTLKDGKEIKGILIEIGQGHVVLESADGTVTILTDMIGVWRVLTSVVENRSDEKGEKQSNTDIEIKNHIKKIESSWDSSIRNAKVTLINPDFLFPGGEIKTLKKEEILRKWEKIKNKFEYAKKINELHPKFGRIQQIINELNALNSRFPRSPTIKSYLGYFHFIAGDIEKALELYQEAAIYRQNPRDWYNIAVIALNNGKKELGCYALENIFYKVPINSEIEAWYTFIGLLLDFNNYPALEKIVSKKKDGGEEQKILLETAVYLLVKNGRHREAANLLSRFSSGNSSNQLILDSLKEIKKSPVEIYQKEIEKINEIIYQKVQAERILEPQGYIYSYKKDRRFGFIRGKDKNTFFFHISAVIDEELVRKLSRFSRGEVIPVVFEKALGPKGPIAIQIALYRTIEEMFSVALMYAESGEYSKAIAQMKQVVRINPYYPEANELLEKWREYARISGVPKGSNPYARAKRAQIVEKNLEKAIGYFRDAIKVGDHPESAIKDLASLFLQLNRPDEAISLLRNYRDKIRNRDTFDNILIAVYKKAGRYSSAISMLKEKLKNTSNKEKKVQILWQIGNLYLNEENYENAEKIFMQVLEKRPDNISAKRNIALCLSKRGRFDEAEALLNEILNVSSDAKSAQLLELIAEARTKGQEIKIDKLEFETAFSDFSAELSGLTRYYLSQCEFFGVSSESIESDESGEKRYIASEKKSHRDIAMLERLARQLGTKRPRDRAKYYLSAARIAKDIGSDTNQFFRYLCRSLASMGDVFVIEKKPLDSAREWYCEALNVYDGYRNPQKDAERYDEQDAVNALCRYLYSFLGRDSIPTLPPHRKDGEEVYKQQLQYINSTVEKVISKHPDKQKVFEYIDYLITRSRYAAQHILSSLYGRSSRQGMALNYLETKGISVQEAPKTLKEFIELWNRLKRKRLDDLREISKELKFLENIELTTSWLEKAIERVEKVKNLLLWDLDKERINGLQKILNESTDLCKQVVFEEKERLCIQIKNSCNDLCNEITLNPTKISIEDILPIIEILKAKTQEYLDKLYETSAPQLCLKLPIESYIPDDSRTIEIQVLVENSKGRGPAENLELIIQEDANYFSLADREYRCEESLRGGENHYFKVKLKLTSKALEERAFSLPIYAQFTTRLKDPQRTEIKNFSIRLSSGEDFEEIPNPYIKYAEGGIVEDPAMFFGRKELLDNIEKAVVSEGFRGKSIIIFGQKRAGKSSILYHLKNKLIRHKDIMVIDLGNIGSILDVYSSKPLVYQILFSILLKLKYGIEDKESEGFPPLGFHIPDDTEFFVHDSPLIFFKKIMDSFARTKLKFEKWKNTRLVLMIDEFSYLYDQILHGRLPGEFMKNWKAILQEGYFSAILAGQDVMPKFKQTFPNEFGTTQDERITYLREEDARRLIDEPIRIGGRHGESRYREKAIERILELTAGSPFYIQIFCNRLVEYMNRKRAPLVTDADVEQVKEELINGVNALSIDKFDNLINSGDTSKDAITDKDALEVLKAIAINGRDGYCHRSNITCKTESSVDAILEDLVKRDVIKRERRNYYQIRVGLFKEWLIARG